LIVQTTAKLQEETAAFSGKPASSACKNIIV
jgi:hypothetical protein